MINYWWVTRPKRKLDSIPEVLSTFAGISLRQQWIGQRTVHLSLEEALEQAGLKREGERRDQGGSGARTYGAWLYSLGLIFTQETTNIIQPTLAGEAILNGSSPVSVLKHQVIKYQFPSAYSTGRSVNVSPRFKIHPFYFLLKLMMDSRIGYLTQDEISKIIIVEAENETDACYEKVVSEILQFRSFGDKILPADFCERYGVKNGSTNLSDVANTMMNWLDYTQLILRENKRMSIVPDKIDEVKGILSQPLPFISLNNGREAYQRKYGVDPNHQKDTRNLISTKVITPQMIAEQQIVTKYIDMSLRIPITQIDKSLIKTISEETGYKEPLVEEILQKRFPRGSLNTFMTKYYQMAFNGNKESIEFENATVQLFKDVFKFDTEHIGQLGRTPDVLLISKENGYTGIIDNKAYSRYTITNDHHNRMVHNYIEGFSNYYSGEYPLSFFSYIAGGFGTNINPQIQSISNETGIHGSCINVHNMIELVNKNDNNRYSHEDIRKLFSLDRQILLSDI